MGNWNSGRRPNPSRLQVLRGKQKAARASEPQPEPAPASFDIPPDELNGNQDAIQEWQRLVPLLRKAGIITAAEWAALVALCIEWAAWLAAQRHIRKDGMIVTGKSGMPQRNPYIIVANGCLKQCQRLWVELGLTPAARCKLTAVPTQARAAASQVPASRWGTDL